MKKTTTNKNHAADNVVAWFSLLFNCIRQYNICIDLRDDSATAPCTMDLSGIVNVSNYTLSVSVLRFTIYLNDFNSVSDFYLLHNVLLNLTLLPFYIYNKSF